MLIPLVEDSTAANRTALLPPEATELRPEASEAVEPVTARNSPIMYMEITNKSLKIR